MGVRNGVGAGTMRKRRPASLAVVLAILAGAGAASADQSRWQVNRSAQTGQVTAAVCPLLDAEVTGNYFCLGFTCTPSGPVFAFWFAGGQFAPQVNAAISVDGSPVATLPMVQVPDPEMAYHAPWNPAVHPYLMQRLMAGQAGVIHVTWGEPRMEPFPIVFALAGSTAALSAVAAACPAPVLPPAPVAGAPAAVGGAVAAPLPQERARFRESCTPGATATFDPGFASTMDADGDGRLDLLVDYGAAACSAPPANPWCGSAGCVQTIWRDTGAGFVRVFSDNVYGIAPEPGGILALQMHGSACGLVGAAPCTVRLGWNGTAFERLR